MQWYADEGIPEFWLAQPIDGDRWGALISRYTLERPAPGGSSYVKVDTTTLADLERHAG